MGLKTQGSSPQGDKLPREKKPPLPTTKGLTLNKLARTTTSYIQSHMILNEYLQLISHFKYSFDLKPNAELALRNCIQYFRYYTQVNRNDILCYWNNLLSKRLFYTGLSWCFLSPKSYPNVAWAPVKCRSLSPYHHSSKEKNSRLKGSPTSSHPM